MSREKGGAGTEVQLSEREMAELAQALRSAHAPGELDPAVNERLIRQALEDPLAPASDEELVESERLRRALEGEDDHPDLDLVRALSTAHRGDARGTAETNELVDRAASAALGKPKRLQHGTVVYLTVTGVLAAAAAVALFFGAEAEPGASKNVQGTPRSRATEPLELSRSSEDLFKARFGRGGTTERVDRIATARARDLRANRFRQWGVE